MPRLRRPHLIGLVIACPVFLIAFVGWSNVDEPLVYLNGSTAGESEPVWAVADTVILACLPVVVLAIILAALVVALRSARRQRPWAAAGNAFAAAIVVLGPAAGVTGRLDSPAAHPELDLLAVTLGVLAGITVLAIVAARAQPDRRTAGPLHSRTVAQPGLWSSQPRHSASCHWPHSSHWSRT